MYPKINKGVVGREIISAQIVDIMMIHQNLTLIRPHLRLRKNPYQKLTNLLRQVFLRLKIMIERIYGDTEPAHIVVAHKAMEAHKAKYGEGNKFHPRIYSVAYRGRFYQIEVVTRRKTMAATVITGVRTLTKVLEVA